MRKRRIRTLDDDDQDMEVIALGGAGSDDQETPAK
jgi:hypothetical protein